MLRKAQTTVSIIFLSVAANSTSFNVRPFPDQVKGTQTIVRGTVGLSYSEWAENKKGQREIYTFTELQVKEIFKGSSKGIGDRLVLRELGGKKDGVGMKVVGAAKFKKGEDVVVMLGEENRDGSRNLLSLMMGKFNIKKDPDGNEYLVGPALASGHSHSHHHHRGTHEEHRKWHLSDLRELVQKQSGRAQPEVKEVADSHPSPDENPRDLSSTIHTHPDEMREAFVKKRWLFVAFGFFLGVSIGLILLRRKKKRAI